MAREGRETNEEFLRETSGRELLISNDELELVRILYRMGEKVSRIDNIGSELVSVDNGE